MKRIFFLLSVIVLAMCFFAQAKSSKVQKSSSNDPRKEKTEYPFSFKFDGNPLVRNHGATDPDVHVWGDTVWMYCSQDHEIIDNDTYATMDGYHAFSSTDLVNWTDHGETLHSRNVKWGVDGFMWAPGAARKKDANGKYKYYIYFPHKDKTNNWKIGVAVGDSPQGPFKDIGKPMEGPTGIDPACFIDDDGQAYLYFGSYKVAKLKPNMIELAEAPRSIDYAPQEILDDDFQRFHEGPFMHKKDGKYYFSYSNFKNNKCQGWYTMGDSPYGPFKWKGPMAPAPAGAQDHHSIIEFKGQWYYFYHFAIPEFPLNKVGQGRIACFDRLYYNNDGTMQMVVHTATPTKILKTTAINGTITLDPPGGAYEIGTKVKLTANGNLGFAFKSWGGDLIGLENSVTIVIGVDKNVSASFKATPTYTLSVKSDNGLLVLNPLGGVYNSGTDVYVMPVKNFGYKFSTWGGDMFGTAVPAKINMNSNKSVFAYYTAIPTYKIAGISPNGIIEFDPADPVYEEGTVVKVNAKKDYGYKFSGWSGDLSGTNNSATLVMNLNKTITANFVSTGEPKIVFATNCGGEAYRSVEGIYYEADSKFNGGSTYSTGGTISGTMDAALHHKERNGASFGYKIPLPNKAYNVSLLFAEIFHQSAGKRIFDVFIEGEKVASNLDIWSNVGKNEEYSEIHTVVITDGELTIDFKAIKDNAKISAIKVVEI